MLKEKIMRSLSAALALAFILTFGATGSSAQIDFSKSKVKTVHVADNIYMLEVYGAGNIGVSIGKDGILIVDDQFEVLSEKVNTALDKLGDKKLKYLINTHWHNDHTDGNKVFGSNLSVVAHTNVRKRLQTEQTIKFFGAVVKPLPDNALPVITFDESLSVHFNGEEIKVIHFPHGHTDGDSIIFFTKSNVVHMGDHFFSGMYPFIDLETGGDIDGYIKNVETVLAAIPENAKLIPGHGPLATKEDLRTFHKLLIETRDLVQQGINAGKSLEQVQKGGLPKKWNSWADGFFTTDQWIEMVYTGLSQK